LLQHVIRIPQSNVGYQNNFLITRLPLDVFEVDGYGNSDARRIIRGRISFRSSGITAGVIEIFKVHTADAVDNNGSLGQIDAVAVRVVAQN
jgi:hypothetical protein